MRLLTGRWVRTALALSVCGAWAIASASPNHPTPSVEGIAVYQAFMLYFSTKTPLARVADVTYQIPLANANRCLQGIKLEKSDAAPTDVHTLPQEIISDPAKFRLVTIGSGSEHHERLLQLSEIAFDASHQYAVLNYSYHCGVLCGEGGTVVFRKSGEKWKHLRSCVEWIS